ncbi:MAG: protoporphyrinogen oxidase HemJ [Leptospiraceae bacterium]|nr:protoporphyrinogen oxidase HemJ [Leptospiraceae bacterium]
MLYQWCKILHIIGLVAWFAGMFYIWRLFVYHVESESVDVKNTLAVMERKLYKIIMRPAMVFTLFFGFMMLYLNWKFYSKAGWIWTKIFLVCILLFLHYLSDWYREQLLKGKTYPSKKFRILNEMPTILLILIVILVILKPF